MKKSKKILGKVFTLLYKSTKTSLQKKFKLCNLDQSYQPKELVSATPQANTYFFPRLDSLSDVFSGEVRHGTGFGDTLIQANETEPKLLNGKS